VKFRRFLPLLAVGFVTLAFVGCDNDPDRGTGEIGPITPRDPIPLTNYVADVAMNGGSGTYQVDEMPSGAAAAPTILGSSRFVRGAQMVMTVTVEDTATMLYVSTTRADIGYFEIDLTQPRVVDEVASARVEARMEKLLQAREARGLPRVETGFRAPRTVTLTLEPAENATSFLVAVRSSDGTAVSQQATLQASVINDAQASDKLQVSLNWIDEVDYDLHLVTPDGFRIFFGAQQRPGGGELDLDSNAACNIDFKNNENITWASAEDPPLGEYTLQIHLWSACDATGDLPYVVTKVVNGTPEFFQGTVPVTESGGDYITIDTFTLQ